MINFKYADMHCDTVTACFDGGADMADNALQLDFKRLNLSGCTAQCFAIFTEGPSALDDYKKYLAFYRQSLSKHGDLILPVKTSADLKSAFAQGKTGAVLTVENLGFTGGNIEMLDEIADDGACMASLVWNNENALAYPNLIFENGLPSFEKREKRGLKKSGRAAVERLDELKIIIDVSHLSDGGTDEILQGRKIPIVASHSNALSACGVCRNLTDGQIKKIADCGGVIGVNFCFDFLGADGGFEGAYRHVLSIINAGGEDAAAFGSDFDGIPPSPELESCEKMQNLIGYLSARLPSRIIEKLCYKNFFRVFKEVRG